MRPEPEPVFPCPLCHQPAGRHDRFAVQEGDTVRIIVRCDACRHRWTVIVPASEAAGPKPTG